MTLNFQNKIVFPAPEHSYTPETAFGQVIYIPRNMTKIRLATEERLKREASKSQVEGKVKGNSLGNRKANRH